MGIFDQAPPPPAYPPNQQQPGTPPQGAPQQTPVGWGQQPPPQAPPAYPPTAAFPPAPQGYAPAAYGGMQTPGGYAPQAPSPGYPSPGYGAPSPRVASPFDSVAGEEVFGDRVPFWNEGDEGTYAVIVGRIARFQTRKPRLIDSFTIEEKVVFSSNPRLPVGASRCKMEQANKDGAGGRIKRILMALGNVPAEGVDDASYHASYSEGQPFFGTILIVEANKPIGKSYINHTRRWPSLDELRKLAVIAAQVDPGWRPAALQAKLLQG